MSLFSFNSVASDYSATLAAHNLAAHNLAVPSDAELESQHAFKFNEVDDEKEFRIKEKEDEKQQAAPRGRRDQHKRRAADDLLTPSFQRRDGSQRKMVSAKRLKETEKAAVKILSQKRAADAGSTVDAHAQKKAREDAVLKKAKEALKTASPQEKLSKEQEEREMLLQIIETLSKQALQSAPDVEKQDEVAALYGTEFPIAMGVTATAARFSGKADYIA